MIQTTKDGRTIRTGADYTHFRHAVWNDQKYRCIFCKRYTDIRADLELDWSFHVHHLNGRGMGGSKRDDVATRDGVPVCVGSCGKCHRKEHNQS